MINVRATYGQRAKEAENPAANVVLALMEAKRTNLTLALDVTDQARFFDIVERVGPALAVLKTHVDILSEFTPETVKRLRDLATRHRFLVFEDRKFADIGKTVEKQYDGGVYRIADWAEIVNAHSVSGPGTLAGLEAVMKARRDGLARGVLLLAQMSPKGNLITDEYTARTVEMGKASGAVAGYIGNGADPRQLEVLARLVPRTQLIFTPGIQIGATEGRLGQQYCTPDQAVQAGADSIIVGSGIHEAPDPVAAAEQYRAAGWEAYLKRLERDSIDPM